MTSDTTPRNVSRRAVLTAAAGTAGLALAAAPAAAAGDYGGWFDGTDNYDGTVDKTGQDRVEITVGASGNGGNFGFGPAAVRVDPGTTVVWTWSGKGGTHNVVAESGDFESELSGDAGHTFERTFEDPGVVKYYCLPHRAMGMKGAVVVGDAGGGGGTTRSAGGQSSEPDYGDWFANTANYDGTVDKTGQKDVTVTVGAEGNKGPYAFAPAAVRVSPGTTVTFEWVSDTHTVTVQSWPEGADWQGHDAIENTGFSTSYAFEDPGVYTYYCAPHEAMGMKGAIVVGDAGAGASGASSGWSDLLATGGGLGLAGALLAVFALASRGSGGRSSGRSPRTR